MQFVLVYIREAHPDSILFLPTAVGGRALGVVPQTDTAADRLKNLHQCSMLLQITMPAVVDNDDNVVNKTYAAWPDRLYAIDAGGKIAFKSGPGPAGFKSQELAEWLKTNIK